MIQPNLQLRDRKIISHLAICLLLLPCLVKTIQAQTDYAKLTVVVRDGNKKPVNNVTVTLSRGDTELRTCTTDNNGVCIFASLVPFRYKVRVPGSPALIVELMPGQNAVSRFDDLGAPGTADAKSKPTVPQDQELLDATVTGRQGERATSKQLEDLPNPDQSERPLIQRQPGAFTTGTTTLGGFIFNGQPGTQNVIQEAGVSSTVIVRSSASFQDTNALFFDVKERQSIKKYKSFSIDTNNTPANMGTGTGGQLIEDISSGDDEDFTGEIYEYFANDALSARNFFDFARKPSLRFHLFGVSVGGPLIKNRLNAFFNYEGIRASSGNTIFAAAPKLSLESSADPAVAPLLRSFRAAGARVVSSSDTNFDIIQLESKNFAERDSVTLRLDYTPKKNDNLSFIYIGSRARENTPDDASGRRSFGLDNSSKGVFNFEHALTVDSNGDPKLKNQFIFAVIHEPSQLFARLDGQTHPALFASAVTIGDEVAQSSVPEQPSPLGIATAGGLLSGDFKGTLSRTVPRQFSFIDQMTWTNLVHTVTFGGEVRMLRTGIDRLFGTTYKFKTLTDFLANKAEVEHVGDLGSATANVGERDVAQEYYIVFLQDARKIRSNLSLTYGLRYEYYTPLRERHQRVLNVDPATGVQVPAGTELYKSSENNFLPRVSFAWAPNWNGNLLPLEHGPLVLSGSFGLHVGPDPFANIVRPITNDVLRVSDGSSAFPVHLPTMIAARDAQDREFTPVALSRDYTSPPRVYKFDFTVKKELVRREQPDKDVKVFKEAFVTLAYVGNRSRNLLLRNFANRIISVQTNPNPELPATVRREFDIENGGELLHPFGEFEYLTTGGRASYDSFQVVFKGRAKKYLDMLQVDYTLARNRGNSDGDDAIPTGNPLDYDYDYGYNALDVRHKFSYTFLLDFPCPGCDWLNGLLRKWTLASTGFYQTGLPIDVRLARPDVVYLDQAGNVFGKPAAGRTAVLNLPGGGSSVAAYRPNLVPGVNPYLNNDRNFLNPAAFSIPGVGQFGDLSRGALRAPRVRLVDLSVQKLIWQDNKDGEGKSVTLNVDVTNLFNFTNFKLPSANLTGVLGTDASNNELQPGQAFTPAATSNFGILKTTFKRKSDLGSSRQIQFGLSVKF